MYIILVLHNLIRWFVILFGLWTLFAAISGVITKRSYTVTDNRSNFFFMLSCDIQLVIGLILYFANLWFDKLKDMGNNMKDTYTRFFTLEHAGMMIIAWVLVHIGRVSIKRAVPPATKYKRALLFYGLAILLIFLSIPWPFRHTIARPLLRWFN